MKYMLLATVVVSRCIMLGMMLGGGMILMIAGIRIYDATPALTTPEASVILGVVGVGGLVFIIDEKINTYYREWQERQK